MTARPETRFRCDRCGVEINTTVANTPLATRFVPPESWLTLTIGEDGPPMHLCPECAGRFRNFLEAHDGQADAEH